MIEGNPLIELSSHRTGLALERTLMSADRTLMAVVRTSVALIVFGFTIAEIFRQIAALRLMPQLAVTGRRLGITLLCLGILMLVAGLFSHGRFWVQLKRRRQHLLELKLLHGFIEYHATPTFIIAACLLLVGVTALIVVVFRVLGT